MDFFAMIANCGLVFQTTLQGEDTDFLPTQSLYFSQKSQFCHVVLI